MMDGTTRLNQKFHGGRGGRGWGDEGAAWVEWYTTSKTPHPPRLYIVLVVFAKHCSRLDTPRLYGNSSSTRMNDRAFRLGKRNVKIN